MSKREVAAMLKVMNDAQYEGRPTEEVIEAAIAALDDFRATTRRLAVVGQIQFGPQDMTHTVVLGPFTARGFLDTEEKFRKVLEGGSAAREAGQDLAWDPKTGRGRGRFMLAPAFWSPRQAWDFYRPTKGDLAEGSWNLGLPEERLQAIRDSLGEWEAHARPAEPACVCGLSKTRPCTLCGGEITRRCARHDQPGGEHRCA